MDGLPKNLQWTYKRVIEDFSHIVLTDAETDAALNDARQRKAWALDDIERKNQRRLNRLKVQEPWTFDELKEDVLQRAKQLPFEFVLDRDNEKVFMLLCLYFSNDQRFEEYGFPGPDKEILPYNLRKGIALVSETKGTGKSILMQLFARNKRMPFMCVSAYDITRQYMKKGEDAIEFFSRPLRVGETASLFYHNEIGVCYEDVGTEENKNSYGNKANVMYEILFSLYEQYRRVKQWYPFHLTSNLTGAAFEKRYDERIRSRMREMFNFIELPGKDRRC